jgi:hypothetical protein
LNHLQHFLFVVLSPSKFYFCLLNLEVQLAPLLVVLLCVFIGNFWVEALATDMLEGGDIIV